MRGRVRISQRPGVQGAAGQAGGQQDLQPPGGPGHNPAWCPPCRTWGPPGPASSWGSHRPVCCSLDFSFIPVLQVLGEAPDGAPIALVSAECLWVQLQLFMLLTPLPGGPSIDACHPRGGPAAACRGLGLLGLRNPCLAGAPEIAGPDTSQKGSVNSFHLEYVHYGTGGAIQMFT